MLLADSDLTSYKKSNSKASAPNSYKKSNSKASDWDPDPPKASSNTLLTLLWLDV
jgi:hypothetical protein